MKNTKNVNENPGFVKYIGLGVFELVAINPNLEKLKELNIVLDKEPVYTSVATDNNPQAFIDLYFKHVNSEIAPFDFIHRVRFFLKKKVMYSNDNTKAKVINKYGSTSYLPTENIKNKTVPEGQAWFATPYTLCVEGQEEFTKFLSTFFGIPTLTYKDKSGTFKTIDNPADAEVGLDNWENLFKGDFSEIMTLLNFPNKVRIAVGVKTVDNKTYQDTFIQHFVKINNNRTEYLAEQIEKAKANGRYANTEFSVEPIRVYKNDITPSTVTEVNTVLPTLDNSLDLTTEVIEEHPIETPEPITDTNNDLPF